MTGDLELVAIVIAIGMVASAAILGTCLIIAAGKIRKQN